MVDALPESFSRLKADDLRRRDFNRFSGVRIYTGTCCTFLHTKGAEAQWLERLKRYTGEIHICADRNSYSKTDHDSSAMFPCALICVPQNSDSYMAWKWDCLDGLFLPF